MLRYNIESLVTTIQLIVCGRFTGGLFPLFRPAGTTIVLPPMGTIFAGVAATGDGGNPQAAESVARGNNLNDNGNPPPYRLTVPEEYVLTPRAFLAIVKSWDVGAYNPPGINCTRWLGKIHSFCELYEVPVSQQALCAMHHMRTDCNEAANAAGCYDMTWDRFTVWLHRYDRKLRTPMFAGASR